jgi:hypothetical protein
MKRLCLFFIIFFVLLSCIGKQENQEDNIFLKYNLEKGIVDFEKSNFSFNCTYIYPNEEVKLYVNNEIIFESKGLEYWGWVFYHIPDTISSIHIESKYNNEIVLDKIFKDTLLDEHRICLILYPPVSKFTHIESENSFSQRGNIVSIDSANRVVSLIADTMRYEIY